MNEEEAHEIDQRIARSLEGKLCSDCPPEKYPDASTCCLSCPHRNLMPETYNPRVLEEGRQCKESVFAYLRARGVKI
jgi:hypothetical protein